MCVSVCLCVCVCLCVSVCVPVCAQSIHATALTCVPLDCTCICAVLTTGVTVMSEGPPGHGSRFVKDTATIKLVRSRAVCWWWRGGGDGGEEEEEENENKE